VYGPVRTVVWQGSPGNRRPYADQTPYWMGKDDSVAWYDLELYIRQPGYGMGYFLGKVEIEKLLTDRVRQLGDKFSLREFHDTFLTAGVIPTSLIRWEMTGLDDEVKTMWGSGWPGGRGPTPVAQKAGLR
jgi:hypothetical protein